LIDKKDHFHKNRKSVLTDRDGNSTNLSGGAFGISGLIVYFNEEWSASF